MAWGGIEVEAGVGGRALTAKTFLLALLCVHRPGRGDAAGEVGIISPWGQEAHCT